MRFYMKLAIPIFLLAVTPSTARALDVTLSDALGATDNIQDNGFGDSNLALGGHRLSTSDLPRANLPDVRKSRRNNSRTISHTEDNGDPWCYPAGVLSKQLAGQSRRIHD